MSLGKDMQKMQDDFDANVSVSLENGRVVGISYEYPRKLSGTRRAELYDRIRDLDKKARKKYGSRWD